jgi:hypothetical protein
MALRSAPSAWLIVIPTMVPAGCFVLGARRLLRPLPLRRCAAAPCAWALRPPPPHCSVWCVVPAGRCATCAPQCAAQQLQLSVCACLCLHLFTLCCCGCAVNANSRFTKALTAGCRKPPTTTTLATALFEWLCLAPKHHQRAINLLVCAGPPWPRSHTDLPILNLEQCPPKEKTHRLEFSL